MTRKELNNGLAMIFASGVCLGVCIMVDVFSLFDDNQPARFAVWAAAVFFGYNGMGTARSLRRRLSRGNPYCPGRAS